MRIFKAELKLLEPLFFATKEISDMYITEPFIGNYALAYALGFATSEYIRAPQPKYIEDLQSVNTYCTPATFEKFKWITESFNSTGESRYLFMDKNMYIEYHGENKRARNIPQIGRLKMIAPESIAVFYVLSETIPKLPPYIRLGKFNSKALVKYQEVRYYKKEGVFESTTAVNPADLPLDLDVISYQSIPVKPIPIITRLKANGGYIQTEQAILPIGMGYCKRV